MLKMREIALLPGGRILLTLTLLVTTAELFTCLLQLPHRKEGRQFARSAVLFAGELLWLCLLLDGVYYGKTQGREIWPAAVDAVYGLPWAVILAVDLILAATLLPDLISGLKKVPRSEAVRIYQEMEILVEEEALLQTRITIHDGLGDLLLICKQYFERPEKLERSEIVQLMKDTNKELLKAAEEQPGYSDVFSESVQIAERIGITVTFCGAIPEDRRTRELLGFAIRECAANTVKHAEGDQLTVTVAQTGDSLQAEIRNNGKPPDSQVLESGGLRSLRRMTETTGGSMEVESSPVFCLRITVPGPNTVK